MSEDTLVTLIETVRDDLRADISDLRTRVDALAARSVIPTWVRHVAVAAVTAVVVSLVTRGAQHVAWTPAPHGSTITP